ncbi:MAG: FHA domain-containing protein [Bacteroidales bacterium]|nr:FHA domain-containing protein [Bacteroidales bacterium]
MANTAAGWLILHTEGLEPISYELHEGRNRIGRISSQNTPDVGVADDKLMSRNHAVLVVRLNERNVYEYILADNAAIQGKPSLNGTYVNGNSERIGDNPVFLKDGDTIQCGVTKFVLQTAQVAVNVDDAIRLTQKVGYANTIPVGNNNGGVTLKRIVKSLILLLMCASNALAQSDVVSGTAKSYAGDTLRMYAVDDYITRHESLISESVVDSEGNFRFNVNVKDVTFAYIDLTVFKCMLYLQPNTKQTIILPEKQKIRPEDELNPFFKKYEFYPKMVSPDKQDLNVLVPDFDRYYNKALNHILMSPYSVTKAHTDSIEADISRRFNSNNTFFSSYIRYRFAMLDYTAYHRNPEMIIKEYFAGKEVLINNPAYNDLFDEMFPEVFRNFRKAFVAYREKYLAIHDKSYYSLRKSLESEEKVASGKLADYLILKGLKDSYYSDTFPKENLVAIADSLAASSRTLAFRNIATSLSEKFTTLLTGWPAPDVDLSDIDGKNYKLADFRGKFTYLIFFNPNSYTALGELELLKNIRATFPPDVLNIVVVFVSKNKSDFVDFVADKQDFGFKLYWYNTNKEMLQKYNVRAYPMYYMVGPDGNLTLNPAPSPNEYFGPKFDKIFREWKNNQVRSQYRNGNQGIR